MSRIHEALKKAELESALGYGDLPSGSELTQTLEVRHEKRSTASDVNVAESKTEVQPSLRFEDLQTHCVQRWVPEPHSNVFHPALNTKAAEQFRTLRSRLYQLRTNQQLKTLLITSAVSGEGKTFLATNLGYAIARQPERRILLIDADLRHSQMHVALGAPLSPGLADYLRGDVSEMNSIQYCPEDNLYFIAGGTQVQNPSELLSNGRLSILLQAIAPIFEWIIFDSPPSLPVADASLLAEHCDASVFVVRARVTPAAVVQRGIQELQDRKIMGVVLNAVDEGVLTYGANYGREYRKELQLSGAPSSQQK